MTRDEIVTALRCCEQHQRCEGACPMIHEFGCLEKAMGAAADLIENQQREIEALRKANEGLRFNLVALHGFGGHPDPAGLKGALSECPVCGGPCNWEPETDTSTCIVCGYTPLSP